MTEIGKRCRIPYTAIGVPGTSACHCPARRIVDDAGVYWHRTARRANSIRGPGVFASTAAA